MGYIVMMRERGGRVCHVRTVVSCNVKRMEATCVG